MPRSETSQPAVIDPRAIEVEGSSRSAFLTRAMLATAGTLGVAAVGPWLRSALAGIGVTGQGGPGATIDLTILGFALTLERLEAEYYERALEQVSLSGLTKTLAEEIAQNEQQHVEKLITVIQVLGGRADKPPRFTFPFGSQSQFLALAQTLEDTGVSAYNGSAPEVVSFEVLEAAGGIVQVEARHAAAIRLVRGNSPSPAFSPTMQRQQVLKAVDKYIVGP